MSLLDLIFAPSDFVGVFNQTLETAYPSVVIEGEVTELRIRKQKWVYFSLQDEYARVHFFGSTYSMQHPIEDGMVVQVRGVPRLHPLYGFSVNVQYVQPVGEGSIKKSADAVMKKLQKEGLFDDSRKRAITPPIQRMALITSAQSAAYHDFIKIYSERWRGTAIDVYDVHVQGERALIEIVAALEYCNARDTPAYDAIVLTRGGGSPEELAVFSSEAVTRAVAASAYPTVVAIGHEIDVSLAELAADARASTPTNAATLLSLHQDDERVQLAFHKKAAQDALVRSVQHAKSDILKLREECLHALKGSHTRTKQDILYTKKLLQALSPRAPLTRGYALVRSNDGKVVRSGKDVSAHDEVTLELQDATASALIQSVQDNNTART